MAITLTCPCGQKQTVTHTTAGVVACGKCGKSLTIPAMGVLASAKPKAAPKPVAAQSSRRLGLLLIAAGFLLLLGASIGWLIWSMNQEGSPKTSNENVVVQTKEQTKVEPAPNERKKPEPEKKAPQRLVEPAPVEKKTPPKDLVEPAPPEKKEPPKDLVDPIKPIVEKPRVIEPIAQVGELPNPFLIKPIEPLPKVALKPPNVMEPLKLVWKLKEGDVFFQELVVMQKPTFKVQGIAIQSVLQYRIVSRFTVKKVEKDGSLVVEQKVELAKLLQADDLTKTAIAGAVMQMPGTTYTLHLNPKMDVTKFEGNVGGPKLAQFGGGMGMQMTSLLDRDGWKELAQATFFQMDRPLKVNERWSKPMTHNWGSLGSWSGSIFYLYFGKQDNFHKIGYALNLAYKAPGAGAGGMLKINGATFQQPQAEGMLLFDSAKGKVVAAEERFRVRGVIQTSLLGQNTQIEIEEDQHFLIRIHDKFIP